MTPPNEIVAMRCPFSLFCRWPPSTTPGSVVCSDMRFLLGGLLLALGSAFLLRTHHHNRAVSVRNDRCGDASYQRPPNPSEAVAAHHNQAGAHLLSQGDYLLGRLSRPDVRLRDVTPGLPDTLDLLI